MVRLFWRKKESLVKEFLDQLTGEVSQEKKKILNGSVNLTTVSTTITKTMMQAASKISCITNFKQLFISEEIQGKISKQTW